MFWYRIRYAISIYFTFKNRRLPIPWSTSHTLKWDLLSLSPWDKRKPLGYCFELTWKIGMDPMVWTSEYFNHSSTSSSIYSSLCLLYLWISGGRLSHRSLKRETKSVYTHILNCAVCKSLERPYKMQACGLFSKSINNSLIAVWPYLPKRSCLSWFPSLPVPGDSSH